MDKKALRKHFIQCRQARSWSKEQAAIAEQLQLYFQTHRYSCVGLYWPIKGEIDPRATMQKMQAQGLVGLLALPRLCDQEMQFFVWDSTTVMEQNAYGLTEPEAKREIEPDLLLVPCVALCHDGVRLGYGGGYFDRYLKQHPRVRTVGILVEAFLCESLPMEVHDRQLDAWITEKGLFER
ncbi:MAG: 5-formyltetrahydrofolate cyclo-ligase [Burkholderiaceae bacterium]|nr:5-formyltetrahydrofolate cyclo-ligase [Burkholderiaceae bacterium]